MSKKKGKNSNYKNNIGSTEAVVETKGLSPKQVKEIAIASSIAVAVIALIVIIVIATTPKTYLVEMDFGDYGKVVLELDESEAPITVANFISLVEDGFYDGLTIFRSQKDFVIQGGQDKTANLTPIKGEFTSNGVANGISHTRGTISMARSNDPNSATSQFFITLHDSAVSSLDGKYAGFGKVVEGMDVVDKIAEALLKCEGDSMGFVSDADAIKIVSVKVIK